MLCCGGGNCSPARTSWCFASDDFGLERAPMVAQPWLRNTPRSKEYKTQPVMRLSYLGFLRYTHACCTPPSAPAFPLELWATLSSFVGIGHNERYQ